MRTTFQAKELSSLSTFLVYNQAKISLGQFQHWHFIDLTINLLLIKNPGVSIVYVVNIYVECRQKEGHKWWKKKQKHNKTQLVQRSKVLQGLLKKKDKQRINQFLYWNTFSQRTHNGAASQKALYKTSLPGWLPTVHSWAPLHRCSKSTWWAVTWCLC